MTKTLVENILKAISYELNNGLVYAVIETGRNKYNCYESIDIHDCEIGFDDDYNERITLDFKDINSIKIEEM